LFNRNRMLALGAVGTLSLFTLIGCAPKTPEATAPEATAPATAAPVSAAEKAPMETAGSGFGEMSTQVAAAKTAVEAGKFDDAKMAMEKVEEAWKTVEDDLKKTDETAYDAIETHMDEANGALKEASPDAAAISEHLNMLETTVSGVSK
jgi:soluble cytochrome b562